MPAPKIYLAQEIAASRVPVQPLDGTRRAAQKYVDRITRSSWWRQHAKPTLYGEVPTKVYVEEVEDEYFGGQTTNDYMWFYRGRRIPRIQLGHGEVCLEGKALADPWVILHELAHVWEYESFHDKYFLYAFLQLVQKYLGIDAHTALVEELRALNARLNYRSL